MVKVSGIDQTVQATTINELLVELKIDPKNIAVVKNGAIISRKNWSDELVCDSDNIEFFSPVGGG